MVHGTVYAKNRRFREVNLYRPNNNFEDEVIQANMIYSYIPDLQSAVTSTTMITAQFPQTNNV